MRTFKVAIVALFLAAGALGCDNSSTTPHETLPSFDSGSNAQGDGGTTNPTTDGSADTGNANKDCYDNPQTHEEIINACTDAVKVTKTPNLPLMQPDGSLPPIQ